MYEFAIYLVLLILFHDTRGFKCLYQKYPKFYDYVYGFSGFMSVSLILMVLYIGNNHIRGIICTSPWYFSFHLSTSVSSSPSGLSTYIQLTLFQGFYPSVCISLYPRQVRFHPLVFLDCDLWGEYTWYLWVHHMYQCLIFYICDSTIRVIILYLHLSFSPSSTVTF